jgi:hypothetical protein
MTRIHTMNNVITVIGDMSSAFSRQDDLSW